MAYNPYQAGELPNLVNVTKRMDPDGSIAKIAELLTETNPILLDFPMVMGNLPTGHQSVVRSDTPEPTWRLLNYGVRPTKSETAQVTDTIGILEAYSEVDKRLASLNGNTAEFRLSEDIPHLAGISNKLARTIFYGDTNVDPAQFHGIAPRYDSLTLSGKPKAVTPSDHLPNVVSLGGTGADLTSIFYISWGEDSVFGIYPKGSKAGITSEDLGEVTLTDNDGGRFQGYRSHYEVNMGISIRDWRTVSRVCNIDLTKLDDPVEQTKLYKAMIKAMHAIPEGKRQRGVWYCGAAVATMLDYAAVEKPNRLLNFTEVFGQELTTFRKRPLRECDAISENEAEVT